MRDMKRIEKAFDAVGIDIRIPNSYRHIDEVFAELSLIWESLDKDKQDEITNSMNEFVDE